MKRLFKKREGQLVLIDGPSGSGKDTLINNLFLTLKDRGLSVKVIVEEEEDSERYLIIKARETARLEGRSGDVEMAQLLIDHRARIFSKTIVPALEDFDVVLLNRGETSTLAYQTARGELTIDEVYQRHRKKGIRLPDMVVILNCFPETAVSRIEAEAGAMRVEREQGSGLSGKVTERMEHRRRIHQRYREVANFLRGRTRVLSIENDFISVTEETELVLRAVML
jgi:thymidylate kinase